MGENNKETNGSESISDKELTNVFSFKDAEVEVNDSPTINMPLVKSDSDSNNLNNKKTNKECSSGKNYKSFYAKKHKRDIILRVVLGVVAAILGLIIGIGGFGLYYKDYLLNHSLTRASEFTTTVATTTTDEHGNTPTPTPTLVPTTSTTQFTYVEEETIHNYLLIGIDSRTSSYSSSGKGGLADVIMVMSVDTKNGTIKMVSIARDSYAHVPGYSYPMKINAAMSLGGPDVLLETVENQLRISIDGYAYVNFYKMASVIDAVGGVYCDVTSGELYSEGGLNWNLAEVNNLSGLAPDYQAVTNYGNGIWLNGRQAVAYARIRKLDSDYKRSERQVEVLRSLLNQYMKLDNMGKLGALDDILSLIVLDPKVSNDEIESLAIDFLPSLNNITIQYMQLPIQGCFYSGMYGGEWSIRPNWNGMIPYVQEFLFGEKSPFDPVDDIKSSPSLEKCPTDINIEDLLR